MREQNYLS